MVLAIDPTCKRVSYLFNWECYPIRKLKKQEDSCVK